MVRLRRIGIVFIGGFFSILNLHAQETRVIGEIFDSQAQFPLERVEVRVENSEIFTFTDNSGSFLLVIDSLSLGEQVLQLSLEGYFSKRFPVVINRDKTLDLGSLDLEVDWSMPNPQTEEILLTDEELEDEESFASTLTGLLSASKDVFYQAAAYDFSAGFFKPKGFDNRFGKVLINGIELNKMSHGRPEWASFGGLNDLKRNEVFYDNLEANPFQFGGISGTTNSIMRASAYRKGGKISYARANQFYRGRYMASYATGLTPSGWAAAFLVSGRFGDHGYMEGTPYNTQSFFASVEKKWNENHSLNFTGFYTPYSRGKSMAMTEEVFSLKGRHYNPYWGFQNGKSRNSRMKKVKEPVFMLNHYWNFNENTALNTNIAYQFGSIGNTRIDNGGTRLLVGPTGEKAYIGGARNPAPDYFQKLPSYHLRHEHLGASDYQRAFLAEKEFLADGQFPWDELITANLMAQRNGGNAIYILQEDREEDRQFTVNTFFKTQLADFIKIEASLEYRNLQNHNFAKVGDLLGAHSFLDIDFYADEPKEIDGLLSDLAQSDQNNPDRLVQKGDPYKYNYQIEVDQFTAFGQGKLNFRSLDVFFSAQLSRRTVRRNGFFKNGYFPEESFGRGALLTFNDFGVKSGMLYKLTGKHLVKAEVGFLTQPPALRNLYANARQNGIPVIGIQSEKVSLGSLSYLYQTPLVKVRFTGFYNALEDGTNIGYYFTQGLSGLGENHDAAFVQEVTTGVNTRTWGVEYGIKAKLTPTISIKSAGSFSQSVYANNPNLYLTSADFKDDLFHGKQREFAQAHSGSPLIFGDGKTKLKNYHFPMGPERVFQVGIEYRDPAYWFVGTTANFFSHTYIDVSKIRRTANFGADLDGLPLLDYDEGIARNLLRQERLPDYRLVNLVGGKSWWKGNYLIGIFGVVNNLFNETYRTGGFESSRKGNYRNYLEDQSAVYGPQFGTNYFFGYGTTFYLNLYVRF